MVPSANICERNLDTQVRLDQLRQLPEAVAERAPWIVRTLCGRVLCRIGCLQHLHRIKGLASRAMQNRISGLVVHRFEGIRDGGGTRIAPTDSKVVDVAHRGCRFGARQDAWQSRTERNSTKSGLAR